MENLKSLDEIHEIDKKHVLLGQVTGRVLSLEKLHAAVSEISLNCTVPEKIRSQFNVARNMAIYTYFMYSLAPEVHMKTYSVMEMALRDFYGGDEKTNLKTLVRKAVETGVIQDRGFRHVPDNQENSYSKNFIDIYPKLRNSMAHGTSMLTPDCVDNIERCADFVNQLFPAEKATV